MITKKVQKTSSVEFIADETFIYCKELNKGFIKRNFGQLNLVDYSFENVYNQINGLTLTSCINNGIDAILFGDNDSDKRGQIIESVKINKLTENLASGFNNTTASEVDTFFNQRNNVSRYFNTGLKDTVLAGLNT